MYMYAVYVLVAATIALPRNMTLKPTMFVTVVILALLGGVVVSTLLPTLTEACLPALQLELVPDKLRGDILATAATILGLTSLGSLIGVKLSSDPKQAETQRAGAAMVISCIIVAIVIQLLTMIGACCYDLYSYTYIGYLVTTGATFIAMVCGYAAVVSAQTKESNYDGERTITLQERLRKFD